MNVAKNKDLTILLTLKGRELFTLRWMWHANRTHMPFHIIIADGEVTPTLTRVLKDKSLFPNLSYEYYEYNDSSLLEFYKKCADAAAKVKTPFVRMADNDDFIFVSGVEKDVEFLKTNPDYVCAQGGVAGFGVKPKCGHSSLAVGCISKISTRYNKNYVSRSYFSDSAEERVLQMAEVAHPIYYCVYRKAVAVNIFSEIVNYNFRDLQVYELFWSWRALTLGKVKSSAQHLSLMRQFETSSHAPMDFAHRIVSGSFIDELRKITADIAALLGNKNQIEKRIKNKSEIFFKGWIFSNYRNRNDLLFKFALKIKWALEQAKKPFQFTRFFYHLKTEGVDNLALANLRNELSEIKRTLRGKEFMAFVKKHAPSYCYKK